MDNHLVRSSINGKQVPGHGQQFSTGAKQSLIRAYSSPLTTSTGIGASSRMLWETDPMT